MTDITYVFPAKVTWYFDDEKKIDHIIIYAASFIDAMTQIENAYGDTIVAVDMFIVDESIYTIPEEEWNRLRKETI